MFGLSEWLARRRAAREYQWLSVLPECVAVASVLALLWWTCWTVLQTHYANDLINATREGSSLVGTIQSDLERLIRGDDRLIRQLRADFLRDPAPFRVRDWLDHDVPVDRLTTQLCIIGTDGRLLSSSAATDAIDLHDRDYFVFHSTHPEDVLQIVKPMLGRITGTWSILLTRRITRPDGRFGGVIVLSLGIDRFAQFYDAVDLRHGFLAISGLDGVLRVSAPLGSDLAGAELDAEDLPTRIRAQPAGTFRRKIRQETYTISYRRLGRYPLVVAIAAPDQDTFAAYHEIRRDVTCKGGAASLLILAIGGIWITQRRRSATDLANLESTLHNMTQGVVVVGSDGRIPVVNEQALELLGLSKAAPNPNGSLRGQALADLGAAIRSALDEALMPGRSRSRWKHGATIIDCTTMPRAGDGVIHILEDVTEQANAAERIHQMAVCDQTTRLGNRVALVEALECILAGRHAGSFSLLAIRLEKFRHIRESLGREMGEQLLLAAIGRLHDALEHRGTLFRLDDADLAFLANDAGTADLASALARTALDCLAAPFLILGQLLRLSGSVGFAPVISENQTAETLIRNAELALAAASADRKTNVQEFRCEMAQAVRDRILLEEELRAAIETEQFLLEFQPQFRASSLEITGFEALARWHHPTRGRISPGEFIPIAEESGLIIPLGRTLLWRACEAAASWPKPVQIAVNLSPVQFRDPELIPMVRDVLAQAGLAPSRLELEVTEGVLISDEAAALDTMYALRRLGVRLALDDFGTGYASLGYLRKFPFERIKIDRSFVQAQVVENRSRQILQSIFDLCRKLQLDVLAEGVETKTQLALLRQQKCQDIQGFLVGRPMSAEKAAELLAGVEQLASTC